MTYMHHVVSCFIKKNGKILILKRSRKVGTYRGKWATVSGYIEDWERDDETAIKEIKEEIGVSEDDVEFIRKAKPVEVKDKEGEWVIHPYLFRLKIDKIRIDWEHDEYKWIDPVNVKNYETAPMLKETLNDVLNED